MVRVEELCELFVCAAKSGFRREGHNSNSLLLVLGFRLLDIYLVLPPAFVQGVVVD
jgi:hypothetical protein